MQGSWAMKGTALSVLMVVALVSIGPAPRVFAQDPVPSPESLVDVFPARRHFSPYAGRNFPTEVFWGDTHLHTSMSLDAGAFGATLRPVDAYRFARGEEVTSSTGLRTKLSRPLDFLVVADHSDNMGFFPRLSSGEPSMLADPTGRRWYDMVQAGGQSGVQAAVEIIQALTANNFPEALASFPGSDAYRSAWEETVDAAEAYNDPGKFTAFIGYEWTSTDSGYNLHRVVVYSNAEVRELAGGYFAPAEPAARDVESGRRALLYGVTDFFAVFVDEPVKVLLQILQVSPRPEVIQCMNKTAHTHQIRRPGPCNRLT